MTLREPFFISVSLALVGSLGVVSCGSSSGGGGSGGSGGGGSDCSSVATELCNKLEQCAPVLISIGFGTVSKCAERIAPECTADTTAPGASATVAQLATCASDYAKLSCNDVFNNVAPASCQLKGSRANGQPCGTGEQCQSGYCKTGGSSCGTCAQRQTAGNACTASSDCVSGLACLAGKCAIPVAAGGQCTVKSDCAIGLTCKSGVCAQPAEAGEACNSTAQDCDGTAGLYCAANSVCTSLGLAKAGQPCGFINGAVVACEAGGHCKLVTGTTQGTCEAPAADGAACNATLGPTCMTPAQCVNGTCQLSNPASCG